jgi:hypothetical protein
MFILGIADQFKEMMISFFHEQPALIRVAALPDNEKNKRKL